MTSDIQGRKSGRAARVSATGFTLIEIMIIVGIIGILIAIAVPSWVRARTLSQARVCQQNLKAIDEAKEMYALEEHLNAGAPVTWDDLWHPSDREQSYLHRFPVCPVQGEYAIHPISELPECSLGSEVFLDGNPLAQHRILHLDEGGS